MSQFLGEKITLEYSLRGKVNDDVIVLIRGLGTQMIDWPHSFIDGLIASGLQVLTFDNRDVGLSQKFGDDGLPNLSDIARGLSQPAYTLKDMASDVIALMDELAIDKAHIYGISMGGMIAQLLAVNYSSRLHSMLTVMSSSSRRDLPDAKPDAQKSLMSNPDPEGGVEAIYASVAKGLMICGSPGYPESLETRLAIARRRYQRNYNPTGVARQMAAVIHDGDRSDRLKSITVKTTVVHGADDPLIPLACGEDTAACIANSDLVVVEGMGHNLPEALIPEMVSIINRHIEKLNH
jgi:pimeloyl-ACP methyl ester carboxylesterase